MKGIITLSVFTRWFLTKPCAEKLWNQAPSEIKWKKSLNEAKRLIKNIAKVCRFEIKIIINKIVIST